MDTIRRYVAVLGAVIAGLLAAGLLASFLLVTFKASNAVDSPPRLADPAPTVAPSLDAHGQYPPQLRGGYDPDARFLGILAIVTPLLTTIVGFYFGTRAGAGPAEAQVERAKAATTSAVNQAAAAGRSAAEVKDSLMGQNLIHR
jgi:hypothetical protein